jgi:ribosomal-protein-alanine N-acetyltransferase
MSVVCGSHVTLIRCRARCDSGACDFSNPRTGRLKLSIRWLIRRDMPEILAIEGESFPFDWNEEQLLSALRQRNCIGMVAEHDRRIVGFMVYELYKTELRIINFAVHSDWQRQGVGRQMVERLKDKLSQQRRTTVSATVRESNTPALRFFRTCGFKATDLLFDHYEDSNEDGIHMAYHIGEPSPVSKE